MKNKLLNDIERFNMIFGEHIELLNWISEEFKIGFEWDVKAWQRLSHVFSLSAAVMSQEYEKIDRYISKRKSIVSSELNEN